MTSPSQAIGAQFRQLVERDYEGKPARVVVGVRTYETSLEDLWDAVTNAERLPRWFAPVSGDLRLGGRYQIEGNAGGTVTRCDPPQALDLTWEFGGGTSWVTLRLEPEGQGVRLTLEHIAHVDIASEEFWQKFGAGAVGVGWDLSFLGLAFHVDGTMDRDAAMAWTESDEGKVFMRASAEAWANAQIAAGEDTETARGMARRTASFYTGG